MKCVYDQHASFPFVLAALSKVQQDKVADLMALNLRPPDKLVLQAHGAPPPPPTPQCKKATHTSQTALAQISRTVHFRDRKIFIGLYNVHTVCEAPFGILQSSVVALDGGGQGDP